MSNVFKSLSPSDYTIVPFEAYSSFAFEYVSGSLTNPEDCQVLVAIAAPSGSDVVRTPTEEYELFDSIIQNFYRDVAAAQTGYVEGESFIPSSSAYVFTVTQDLYGNRIVPGTFSIGVGTSASIDDGKGNIYVSSSIVGRVFYDKGIAIVSRSFGIPSGGLTTNGLCIVSGTQVQTRFTSSVQLYEHSIRIKVNPTEFLAPINNPSMTEPMGDSTPLEWLQSGSGSFKPYVTTIGLYNDNHELLVVAKLSSPVQRTSDLIQTFVLRFDT